LPVSPLPVTVFYPVIWPYYFSAAIPLSLEKYHWIPSLFLSFGCRKSRPHSYHLVLDSHIVRTIAVGDDVSFSRGATRTLLQRTTPTNVSRRFSARPIVSVTIITFYSASYNRPPTNFLVLSRWSSMLPLFKS